MTAAAAALRAGLRTAAAEEAATAAQASSGCRSPLSGKTWPPGGATRRDSRPDRLIVGETQSGVEGGVEGEGGEGDGSSGGEGESVASSNLRGHRRASQWAVGPCGRARGGGGTQHRGGGKDPET